MDLRNLIPKKRNTSVYVNGASYKIDADGICKGLKEADAKKMLKSDAWTDQLTVGKKDKKPKAARSMLVTGDDTPVEGQIDHDAPDPEDVPDSEPDWPDETEDADEDESDSGGEPEWPDPTEDMEMDYLHKMADAYDVTYSPRLGAAKLCERITEKMYPDGK